MSTQIENLRKYVAACEAVDKFPLGDERRSKMGGPEDAEAEAFDKLDHAALLAEIESLAIDNDALVRFFDSVRPGGRVLESDPDIEGIKRRRKARPATKAGAA